MSSDADSAPSEDIERTDRQMEVRFPYVFAKLDRTEHAKFLYGLARLLNDNPDPKEHGRGDLTNLMADRHL